MFVLAYLTIFIIIFVYYYYEIAKLISFQLTIKNLTMTIISRMRLWDPFDLHNSRPATAAVRYMARDWSNLFSELILTDYDKMRLNLQFLPTNRAGRKGNGIVAFIKIDIRMCVCVAFYPIFHLCGRRFDFETPRKPTAADRYRVRWKGSMIKAP